MTKSILKFRWVWFTTSCYCIWHLEAYWLIEYSTLARLCSIFFSPLILLSNNHPYLKDNDASSSSSWRRKRRRDQAKDSNNIERLHNWSGCVCMCHFPIDLRFRETLLLPRSWPVNVVDRSDNDDERKSCSNGFWGIFCSSSFSSTCLPTSSPHDGESMTVCRDRHLRFVLFFGSIATD